MGSKRTVTIRGVDGELYDKVVALAREMGKTVGEVINEAMRMILSIADRTASTARDVSGKAIEVGKAVVEGMKESIHGIYEVSDIDELEITKEDLENCDTPIAFRNIKRLIFSDDVTQDLIDSKVYSIVMCDEVVIPRSIQKIKLLKKCRFVKKIVVR